MQFNQWSKEEMNREDRRRRKTLRAMREAQTGATLAQAIREHTVTYERAIAWTEGMIFMDERVGLHQEALQHLICLSPTAFAGGG